jgi:hypothetical protein
LSIEQYMRAKRIWSESHDTDAGVEFDSDHELEQDDRLVHAAELSGSSDGKDDTLADMAFRDMLLRPESSEGDESDHWGE